MNLEFLNFWSYIDWHAVSCYSFEPNLKSQLLAREEEQIARRVEEITVFFLLQFKIHSTNLDYRSAYNRKTILLVGFPIFFFSNVTSINGLYSVAYDVMVWSINLIVSGKAICGVGELELVFDNCTWVDRERDAEVDIFHFTREPNKPESILASQQVFVNSCRSDYEGYNGIQHLLRDNNLTIDFSAVAPFRTAEIIDFLCCRREKIKQTFSLLHRVCLRF